ncbi:MFS transporter [Streptomyces sp. DSM 44917]|uniref:MFS transporter n=1 Tax=Streptomyces boetiae TaxID=3075541 RepID=A0ABU2L4L7_9ACTN|nr:MFS transporter [Streptomyces sp. DSM 44917]MDT0306480.1 MFS transporter [Streptomyces sp. DSM 44917]
MRTPAPAPRPGAVLTALLLTVGTYTVMQTMVIPALPVMTGELDTDTATAGWLITAFLLGSAVLTPVLGALGDRYGHRRMLLVTLGVYLAGTAAAALAPDVGTLIALRAVQGVSMATLPLSLAVIRQTMPPERMASSFGLTAAMLGGGAGAGLVLGGLIIDNASWRWMFAFLAALVSVAAWLVARLVPESPRPATGTGGAGNAGPAGPTNARGKGVDLPGALLLAGALALLLLGITQGTPWGWTSPGVLGLFAGSLLLFVLLIPVESRSPRPLVDLRLFAHPPLLVVNLAALLLGVVPFFFYVLLPRLFQTPGELAGYGHGLSVVQSGLLMLPSAAAVMLGGRLAPPLRARTGPRIPLAAALAVCAAGAVLTALWHRDAVAIAAWFCLIGLGVGCGLATLAELVAELVPPSEIAAGNGLNTVARTVGSALGGQLTAALLEANTAAGSAAPDGRAFTVSFWLAAGLAGGGIVLTAALRPRPYRPASPQPPPAGRAAAPSAVAAERP